MQGKKCFKCGKLKDVNDFYIHPRTSDGHLGKCKKCSKQDSQNTYYRKIVNPVWAESERIRNREKAKRLGKTWKQPNAEQERIWQLNYREKYPEKIKAKNGAQYINHTTGYHNHHWSYLKEHYKDVIELSASNHAKIHRYIKYDQERMMYRKLDGVLIDSRESALKYYDTLKKLP